MINYVCDGCKTAMEEKDYRNKNNTVEGLTYCHNCRPKVQIIIGDLQGEKTQKLKDVDTWYATEKAKRIDAQTIKGMVVEAEIITEGSALEETTNKKSKSKAADNG
jgi:hypothetical protein